MTDSTPPLIQNLKYLKLPFMLEQHQGLAMEASKKNWSHLDYLEKLVDGEAVLQQDRAVRQRIRMARFPVVKTLGNLGEIWGHSIAPYVNKNFINYLSIITYG